MAGLNSLYKTQDLNEFIGTREEIRHAESTEIGSNLAFVLSFFRREVIMIYFVNAANKRV